MSSGRETTVATEGVVRRNAVISAALHI
jgi:hypothetical protein